MELGVRNLELGTVGEFAVSCENNETCNIIHHADCESRYEEYIVENDDLLVIASQATQKGC